MKMNKKLWALPLLCLLSLPAQASLVTSFPDISGINDLEWLELGATRNESRNAVTSQMATPGGRYYGWRYATVAEAEALTYGLWGGITIETDVSNFNGAQRFFDSFGVFRVGGTDTESGYTTAGAIYWSVLFGDDGECSGGDITISCRGFISANNTLYGASEDNAQMKIVSGIWTRSSSTALYDTGSLLVRTAEVVVVPLPAAFPMFLGGTLLLSAFARRKKAF